MRIQDYELSAIDTGTFGLDGGAMFGVVPKAIWQKTNPADSENRIELAARALLIQSSDKNILVDCGMGHKWNEKKSKIFALDHSKSTLEKSLAKKGLKPEDITDVIQTHLHFDHAGGLTRLESDQLIPTFPNATVHLQRRNWDLAWNPSEKDRASYLQENFALYKDSPKLKLYNTPAPEPTTTQTPAPKEQEILPGISVQVSHGHTLGMQLVRVSSDQTSIVYCADMIPTSTHTRVPFVMGYDCFPMFIMEEKKQILGRAADEGSMLFYEHCPKMAASKITRTAKGDFEAIEPQQL